MSSFETIILTVLHLYLPTAYDDRFDCPHGSYYMYDNCYYLNTELQDYYNATEAAAEKDATLISIHSESANRWIGEHLKCRTLLEFPLWIGVNRLDNFTQWVNPDGSDADYFDWAPSNPATYANTQCVQFSTDTQWYTQVCSQPAYSLWNMNITATEETDDEESSSHHGHKGQNTALIIGLVVGLVGGTLLIGLGVGAYVMASKGAAAGGAAGASSGAGGAGYSVAPVAETAAAV
jgi:hypothetical protein